VNSIGIPTDSLQKCKEITEEDANLNNGFPFVALINIDTMGSEFSYLTEDRQGWNKFINIIRI